MYYSEKLYPFLLKNSKYIIAQEENAADARYYFVPQFSTCFYHDCVFNRNETTDECKFQSSQYLNRILTHVHTTWTFWNSSSGIDHIFVFSWDQASEVFGFYSEIKTKIANSIHLTTLGASKMHPNYNPHKDIVIPPYITNLSLKLSEIQIPLKNRQTFAYFRGTILEDLAYSHGVRQYIRELGNLYPDLYSIHIWHSPKYWDELRNSRFCLCPSGWSSWSPRLFESIVAGVVPIIFADGVGLPFEKFIDYRKVSIKLLNDRVGDLNPILKTISNETLQSKMNEMKSVRHRFIWNDTPQSQDAFEMSIKELWRKGGHRKVVGDDTWI